MSASPSHNPTPNEPAGATDQAPPRRDQTGSRRQVEPRPTETARRDSEPPPPADVLFVNHLSAAGVLGALDSRQLRRLSHEVASHGVARQLDIIERYFTAHGDYEEASRRRLEDRYLALRHDEELSAMPLARRIAAVIPELAGLSPERIGGPEGPVVLRWAEHVSAVVDEYDEEMETGEVDLRDLDDRPSVTVRGMIRATNRLLLRAEVGERLVPLATDDKREVYLGMTLAGAVALLREGLLEEDTESELLEFASWHR